MKHQNKTSFFLQQKQAFLKILFLSFAFFTNACSPLTENECGPFTPSPTCTCEDGRESVRVCYQGFLGDCICDSDTNVDDVGSEPDVSYECFASAEICDLYDNDCDGSIDEGVCENRVCGEGSILIEHESASFCIFIFEASHPDATQTSEGSDLSRPVSRAFVQPWRNITFFQARDACLRAGMRLCRSQEWIDACQGRENWSFPYHSEQFDEDACGGYSGQCYQTGESNCESPDGTMDMIGNLVEWTNFSTVRGGSYLNAGDEDVLRCDASLGTRLDSSSVYPSVGFRCCGDPF